MDRTSLLLCPGPFFIFLPAARAQRRLRLLPPPPLPYLSPLPKANNGKPRYATLYSHSVSLLADSAFVTCRAFCRTRRNGQDGKGAAEAGVWLLGRTWSRRRHPSQGCSPRRRRSGHAHRWRSARSVVALQRCVPDVSLRAASWERWKRADPHSTPSCSPVDGGHRAILYTR